MLLVVKDALKSKYRMHTQICSVKPVEKATQGRFGCKLKHVRLHFRHVNSIGIDQFMVTTIYSMLWCVVC